MVCLYLWFGKRYFNYSDVIMCAMAHQITGVSIVYSTVCSGTEIKKTPMPRVTGLCEGNSPVTGEFPTQRASNAENVSIWWRHHITFASHVLSMSPAMPPWRTWVNISHESTKSHIITTTKQIKIAPCAYFGDPLHLSSGLWVNPFWPSGAILRCLGQHWFRQLPYGTKWLLD